MAGSEGTGGASFTGDSSDKGGATSGGGSSGGTSDTGGVSATGGAATTGGSSSMGGSTTAGGSKSAGASSASGGSATSGGTSATGGTKNSGGSAGGVGGSKPVGGTTGGTATGGNATGGSTGGSTEAGGNTHTGAWKVMMLGNSITGTCYPQILSAQLIAGKRTNFQFVGTQQAGNTNCGANTPSVKTEGHGGYGVTYLPSTSTRPKCTKQPQGCGSYAELQTWAAEAPDIVLMHFATNDVWDGRPTSEILSSFAAVITEFRRNNPDVIFFVSKIIELSPSGCGSCLSNVAALAAALTPAWASSNSTASSPVYIIDHYGCGFDPSTDAGDGVHPNPTGATKMATASYNALVASGYF
ncbi:MAG TPA: GDSL-type esterase/lipase family protein [Polyangia bacterium]|nr:GDSL-type esterase/lipase family protein [Polyangia bacterium]